MADYVTLSLEYSTLYKRDFGTGAQVQIFRKPFYRTPVVDWFWQNDSSITGIWARMAR